MKNSTKLAFVVSLMVSACGGDIERASDSQPYPSESDDATQPSPSANSTESDSSAPDYVCDANPAIEVEMHGAIGMSTSIVVGGPVSSVTIINHCDVIMKYMRFRIMGADTDQYVIGTEGTNYFTNWRVMNSASQIVMGPLEFSSALNPGSVDSDMMVFSDEFSISEGEDPAFNLNASFSQTEDAPGQFKHGDKLYFVYWNDGERPFELGDVEYADGTDIPLDRIKAPSNGLYTYLDMPQNLP